MWPNSINNKTDQEPDTVSDLEMSMAPASSATEPLALEALPLLTEEQPWDSTAEEAWTEHSETAWALVYVIHRVRSTPLPPTLPPAQQQHFHKIIEMAVAMLEDWQRRERDQARQLALRGLITELEAELLESGANPDEHTNGNGQMEYDFLVARRMSIDDLLADVPEEGEAAEAQPHHHQDDHEEDGTAEVPPDDQNI